KIQHGLGWDLPSFARAGGLVFGACNGFQALIKLGVFGRDVSITRNRQGKFIDTWVRLDSADERCVWLRGTTQLDLPIRHGEGRIVFSPDEAGESHRLAMKADGRVCLTYSGMDPNGSTDRIAGLCDETGRIFGLMPHPEAYVRATAHPGWTADTKDALERPGDGLAIFKNAYEEARRAAG
ncbi:MAG: phosphoribosylformylglycinamidine synthase subunit PurQ, partial [Bdellovibrionota bacterium]